MKCYRQILFLFAGTILLVLTSCRRTHPEPKPLTERLETFSTRDRKGRSDLSGVRITGTDSIIVPPDRFERITADRHVIVCVKKTDGVTLFWVYLADGRLMGCFDTFNHLTPQAKKESPLKKDEQWGYYLGTNYNQKCYYFPKTETLVNTRHAYEGSSVLFLQDSTEWKAFTYDGDKVANLPQNATVIHSLTAEAKENFFLVNEKNGKVSLENIGNGQTEKTYSIQEWHRMKAKQESVRSLSGLDIILMK